ncbi:hypothetical protein PGTDC60_1356 [Porphyromonas gingivalis TDC60]|nr:hypothetical protein PGTDC60_1356 [Porphyromonas gingivalis TDC60]
MAFSQDLYRKALQYTPPSSLFSIQFALTPPRVPFQDPLGIPPETPKGSYPRLLGGLNRDS